MFQCFEMKTFLNNNVPGLSQPASNHTLPKKEKTWDVSKTNIIVVRAGDFAQFL